jgi:hypothetical protein
MSFQKLPKYKFSMELTNSKTEDEKNLLSNANSTVDT